MQTLTRLKKSDTRKLLKFQREIESLTFSEQPPLAESISQYCSLQKNLSYTFAPKSGFKFKEIGIELLSNCNLKQYLLIENTSFNHRRFSAALVLQLQIDFDKGQKKVVRPISFCAIDDVPELVD